MTTARDMISSALRLAGVLAAGETASADEAADALTALNHVLGTWSAEGLMPWADTVESFTLTAGTAEYTYGSGGDFDSNRPERIEQVWVRDSSNYDWAVRPKTLKEYDDIASKTQSGRPEYWAYNPAYALGAVYLWPTPDATESIYFRVLAPLTQMADLDTTITIPSIYERALRYALAEEIIPEYGVAFHAALSTQAARLKTIIKRQNAQPVTPIKIEPASTWRFESG